MMAGFLVQLRECGFVFMDGMHTVPQEVPNVPPPQPTEEDM